MGVYSIGKQQVNEASINETLQKLSTHKAFKGALKDKVLSDEGEANLLNQERDGFLAIDRTDLDKINHGLTDENKLTPSALGDLARYTAKLLPGVEYQSVDGLNVEIPEEFAAYGFKIGVSRKSGLLALVTPFSSDQRVLAFVATPTGGEEAGKPPIIKAITTRTLDDGKKELAIETNYNEKGVFVFDLAKKRGVYLEYFKGGLVKQPEDYTVQLPDQQSTGSTSAAQGTAGDVKPLTTDALSQAITNRLPEGNCVVSSYSVINALMMLLSGLSDEEYKDAAQKLGLSSNLKKQLEHAANVEGALLKSGNGIEIKSANRVYASPGTLTDGYKKHIAENFNSKGAHEIDFVSDPEAARKAINSWVSENTGGMIPELLQSGQITAQTTFALVNALFFKGLWSKPFDKKLTTDRKFDVSKSRSVEVPTMYQKNFFPYYEDENKQFQALSLPYQGKAMSMVVVLPKEAHEITPHESLYRGVLDKFEVQDTSVYLPKFVVKTRAKLNDSLNDVGLGKILGGGADYSSMTQDRVDRIEALTEVVFEIDEEGSKGAAAVAMVAARGGGGGKVFRANRPFYFAVVDHQTQTVLFSGKVEDPSQ